MICSLFASRFGPGTVNAASLDTGTCWAGTLAAQRYIYSVTVGGKPGIAAIASPGDAYFDCGYDPRMTGTVQPLFSAPFGQTVPCYIDRLFLTPFSSLPPGNLFRAKDFAYLYFSNANITSWNSGEGYRLAGLYLGYIWIAFTVMVSAEVFLLLPIVLITRRFCTF